jgi:hypothetical protein
MKCETCHGVGTRPVTGMPAYMRLPCADCGGSGLVHCCAGECAQPAPPAPDSPASATAGRDRPDQ